MVVSIVMAPYRFSTHQREKDLRFWTYVAELAGRGDLPALQRWGELYNQGWEQNSAVYAEAVAGGHLSVLQWLYDRSHARPSWDATTCAVAVQHGHLHILQWLKAQNCPWDSSVWWEAMRPTRANILAWLKRHFPPHLLKINEVVYWGHVDALSWLKDATPPDVWAADTGLLCTLAARQGHLDVLQWLRQNDCPWNEATCTEAATHGHLTVLQWLRSQGCPWCVISVKLAAVDGQQWHVVQWLVEHNLPVRTTVETSWRLNYYLARQWLATHHYIIWDARTLQWFRAIEATTRHVLDSWLCSDVVQMIHRYC